MISFLPKRNMWLGLLLFGCVMSSLTACTHFKAVQFQPEDKASLDEKVSEPIASVRILEYQDPLIFSRYELQDYTISENQITGTITSVSGYPIPNQVNFPSKRIPEDELDRFRQTLFISLKQSPKEGPITIPLDQVEYVTHYPVDKGVSSGRSVGLILLLAIYPVRFIIGN